MENPWIHRFTRTIATHSTSVIGSFLTNITQLSPAGVVEGTEAQIKVIGSNFRPSHQVLLNGKKIHSRFVNGRELEIQIPATNPGTHKITVIDPGVAASELNAGYLVVGYR